MEAVTFTEEISSPIPAQRMFKALIQDGDNLIPKLMPQAIKNIELIQDDRGPWSTRQMDFTEGSQLKHLKHRNVSYMMIEGSELMHKVESISYEIKFEMAPDGGCKVTSVSKYHLKPRVAIDKEEIKAGKEKAMAVFKAVEAYLMANPEAYA